MRASCVVRGAWVLLLSACNPASTRPSFVPIPEAMHVVINAPPAVVTREARGLLAADTIRVRFSSERDAWLETGEFAGTHRLYRPLDDPSRQPRDLERAAEPGSAGLLHAARLLEALKAKLGVTNY